MQNATIETTTLSTATTDVVQNDVAQGSNFNLNGAAVIANGVQISEASQKVVAEQISGVNQAIFALEQLEAEREHWETNELAASHKRLYSLLTRCYQYYLDMKLSASKTERDDKRKGLETFLFTRQYDKRLENTHDMNKVVKSVFGNIDRRRVSAYSLALRAALIAGPVDSNQKATAISADSLADWLASQGGVEEVRLGGKNNGKTAKQRAEVAKAAIESQALLSFKPDAKRALFDTEDVDKMCVLVATYRPNGELDISAVVKNDAAVRAALAAYYSQNKEDLDKQAPAGSKTASTSATDMALVNAGTKAE